jgi:hypothetical protein
LPRQVAAYQYLPGNWHLLALAPLVVCPREFLELELELEHLLPLLPLLPRLHLVVPVFHLIVFGHRLCRKCHQYLLRHIPVELYCILGFLLFHKLQIWINLHH